MESVLFYSANSFRANRITKFHDISVYFDEDIKKSEWLKVRGVCYEYSLLSETWKKIFAYIGNVIVEDQISSELDYCESVRPEPEFEIEGIWDIINKKSYRLASVIKKFNPSIVTSSFEKKLDEIFDPRYNHLHHHDFINNKVDYVYIMMICRMIHKNYINGYVLMPKTYFDSELKKIFKDVYVDDGEPGFKYCNIKNIEKYWNISLDEAQRMIDNAYKKGKNKN